MITKRIITGLLTLVLTQFAFGQAEEEIQKEKKIEHYLSIQVNELIRNVINLSNSSSVSNPYIFIYSFNSVKSGLGINIAAGYNYVEETTGDAITPGNSKTDVASFRLGLDKKYKWGKHWIGSAGIDGLYSNSTISSTTTTFNGLFTTESTTLTKKESVGAGIRGGIMYAFNHRIILGTEANYAFLVNKVKKSTDFTETEETTKSLSFNSPVAIFFTVRF